MTYPKAGPDHHGAHRRDGEPPTGVPASPVFPEVEAGILRYWHDDDTFAASVERHPKGVDGANEYVFYDGPPFANGLPHYGHLLTGYVKDVVPRYQTMRGRRVERRFGWDCHGLPAEVEAEKQLGHRAQVRDRGDGRRSVQRRLPHLGAALHRGLGGATSTARPAGSTSSNDYKTLDLDYMESVMWAFKTLWDKGLRLRGLPGAGLLLALRDAAVQHRDPHGRRLPRPPGPGAHGGVPARRPASGSLAWTTTPWTLPSQPRPRGATPTSTTSWSRQGGERYVLAAGRLAAYDALAGRGRRASGSSRT